MHRQTRVQSLLLSASFLALVAPPLASAGAANRSEAAGALEEAYAAIHGATFIDLTHSFSPAIPHWKGFEPETVTSPYTIEKDGFHVEVFTYPGQ